MLDDGTKVRGGALYFRDLRVGAHVVHDGADALGLFHHAGKDGEILLGCMVPLHELRERLAVELEGGEGLPQLVRDHRGNAADEPRALQDADALARLKLLGLEPLFAL